jgi:hypothetical protein
VDDSGHPTTLKLMIDKLFDVQIMDEISQIKPPRRRGASPLRIGLLVDSVLASQYVYDLVRWAQSHPNITVAHLILHSQPEIKSVSRIARFLQISRYYINIKKLYFLISELALHAVNRIERAIIKKDQRHSGHLRKCDLSLLVKNIIVVTSVNSDSDPNSGGLYNGADAQRIKELNLDLLLRCGSSNLRGEILSASRLGIIALQLGDDRIIRGGPAGFWEVYFREETTGFAIQRLTDEVNSSQVLMRGRFATRHYYLLNQAFVLRKASYYLKLIIERIAFTDELPKFLPNYPYSQKSLRGPTAVAIIIYAAKRCQSIFIKRLRRIFGVDYRFAVAYVRRDWKNVELSKGVKLNNRPFHYLADPFVICRNEKNYCFVEDFDYVKQRGSIDVYELGKTGGVRVGTALEEKFHLSFPYLFEHQGELFMCPESSKNKDIRVYKCVDFPLQWELEKIIMENICAADTMIFPKNGKWWMLTNIDPVEIGDYCSELFIFSANSPLESRWKPHPMNPVVVDASRARNAGMIVDGDRYFRCSQGQGFDFYGKRVLINEITALTDSSYVETCSSVISPSFGARVVGTHHLHSNGKITVFDFVTSSAIKTEGNSSAIYWGDRSQ